MPLEPGREVCAGGGVEQIEGLALVERDVGDVGGGGGDGLVDGGRVELGQVVEEVEVGGVDYEVGGGGEGVALGQRWVIAMQYKTKIQLINTLFTMYFKLCNWNYQLKLLG